MRRRTFLTYCLRAITVRDTDCEKAHNFTFTSDASHAGAVRLKRAYPLERTAVESDRYAKRKGDA
jgi:hypothetical protein